MTYKLEPGLVRIMSPILLCFPDGHTASFSSGEELIGAVFEQKYRVVEMKALDSVVEIRLETVTTPLINPIGEETFFAGEIRRRVMITGIHHFSIIASSEASVEFYTSLGFRECRRIERGYDTVVLMEGYGVGLEVFVDASHAPSSAEPLGLRTLALRVDSIEETVKALGLKVGSVMTDWNGKRYVMITDPDGNDVQLCE